MRLRTNWSGCQSSPSLKVHEWRGLGVGALTLVDVALSGYHIRDQVEVLTMIDAPLPQRIKSLWDYW